MSGTGRNKDFVLNYYECRRTQNSITFNPFRSDVRYNQDKPALSPDLYLLETDKIFQIPSFN
jgi:hypothetical protein